MANPEVLNKLLHKLVRLNALIGSPAAGSIGADIAAIQTLIGQGTAVSISADQVVIKAVVDATDGAV